MGRKANWFRAVKQALGSECKDHQDQRSTKSKKKWFVKKKKKKSSPPIPNPSTATDNTTTTAAPATTPAAAPPVEAIKQLPAIPSEDVKLKEEEEEEDEQKKHAQSIAIATAKAAEAAAAAAQAAAEVVRLTNAAPFPGKPKEEVAALTIQTAFRGYLARRAFCALRGLASLKIVMQVQCIKHPTTNTLKSMQSLVRVQSQVRNRRLRMPEDNQVRMGLTLEKQVKELEKVENLQQNGNDWNASPKSKEQMEARLQSQHEAAIRRERALAYSLNHEKTRRSSPASKSARTIFMDMKSGHSGWSWLERWLAARPWETANSPDLGGAQMVSEKQTPSPRSLNTPAQKGRTSTGRLSTSTPSSKARLSSAKPEHTSPKASPRRSLCCAQEEEEEEEEAKSVVSGQSGSSESVSASSLPSYMAPTESARAKASKHEAADRLSVCSAKKRASSPARSRRSASSITDANSIAEQQSFINAM